MSDDWCLVTLAMPFCFIIGLLCIILQYKSFLHAFDNNALFTRNAKLISHKQVLLLYGSYSISVVCSLQCFLCHISNEFPEWYCEYGMAICVIFYAAAKTFLYGFLLERASVAQPNGEPLLPYYLLQKFIPIYLSLYFLMYLISCSIAFRGTLIHDIHAHSACYFGKFIPLIFQISSLLDVVHSVFFVYLFLAPMFKSILNESTQSSPFCIWDKESILSFASSVNINIFCTVICCVSSITFMWIMSYGHNFEYIWLGGNIDMMINCVTTFNTLSPNRHYVSTYWPFSCFGMDCTKIMECQTCCPCVVNRLLNQIEKNKANNSDNNVKNIEII